VDRHVALAARTDDRRDQARLAGDLDVVDVEAVVVADEGEIAAERDVRVRESEGGRCGRGRRVGGRCVPGRWGGAGRGACRARSGRCRVARIRVAIGPRRFAAPW
jgi:hypothetical protein